MTWCRSRTPLCCEIRLLKKKKKQFFIIQQCWILSSIMKAWKDERVREWVSDSMSVNLTLSMWNEWRIFNFLQNHHSIFHLLVNNPTSSSISFIHPSSINSKCSESEIDRREILVWRVFIRDFYLFASTTMLRNVFSEDIFACLRAGEIEITNKVFTNILLWIQTRKESI